jgi:hypothetical protein
MLAVSRMRRSQGLRSIHRPTSLVNNSGTSLTHKHNLSNGP